jgi:hypothetical protein
MPLGGSGMMPLKDRLRAEVAGCNAIIFPQSANRFVKNSAQGYRAERMPSSWMKLKEAKPLVIAAWDDWTAKRDLGPDDATGRDTLQFFCDLQVAKAPLLHFVSRTREQWQVILDWIVSERRLWIVKRYFR